jgi:hypothetical protein
VKGDQRSLCDLLLLVSASSVTVVLAATVVIGKIEVAIVPSAVEDCSDVKEGVSALVCASFDRIASKPHISYPMGHRMKSVLT